MSEILIVHDDQLVEDVEDITQLIVTVATTSWVVLREIDRANEEARRG